LLLLSSLLAQLPTSSSSSPECSRRSTQLLLLSLQPLHAVVASEVATSSASAAVPRPTSAAKLRRSAQLSSSTRLILALTQLSLNSTDSTKSAPRLRLPLYVEDPTLISRQSTPPMPSTLLTSPLDPLALTEFCLSADSLLSMSLVPM